MTKQYHNLTEKSKEIVAFMKGAHWFYNSYYDEYYSGKIGIFIFKGNREAAIRVLNNINVPLEDVNIFEIDRETVNRMENLNG